MAIPSMKEVVRRLDLLDGVENGIYSGIDLCPSCPNTTATVCILQEELAAALGNVPITTAFKNAAGKTVDVDCKILAERLNILVSIAEKNPAARFLASRQKEVPTKEDLYLYHTVDHMISALLEGVATTSMPLGDVFSLVLFDVYGQTIDGFCQMLPQLNCADNNLTIRNTAEGYKLFEAMGKKYGFDPAPFRPTARPAPTPTPAPTPPQKEECPEPEKPGVVI